MAKIVRPNGERDLRVVFWENVERFRQEKGLSIASFCENVGYPIRTYKDNIARDEAGSVSFPTVQKFAKYLGVNSISLFEDWS